jgi:hypothetical protein
LNAAPAPLAPAALEVRLSAPMVEAVAPDSFSLSVTLVGVRTALVVASYHTARLPSAGGIHVHASPFSAAPSAAAHATGSGHAKTLVSLAEEESVRMGTLASEQMDGGIKPVSAFMLSTLQPSGRGAAIRQSSCAAVQRQQP